MKYRNNLAALIAAAGMATAASAYADETDFNLNQVMQVMAEGETQPVQESDVAEEQTPAGKNFLHTAFRPLGG